MTCTRPGCSPRRFSTSATTASLRMWLLAMCSIVIPASIANGIETVSQLPGDLGFGAEFRHQPCGSSFSASFQRTDQLVDNFPRREPRVGIGIPVCGQFLGLEQAYL